MISIDFPAAYILTALLFFIGIYGLLRSQQLEKVIISIMIMQLSSLIFILLVGYRYGGNLAILPYAVDETLYAFSGVDPLSQNMALLATLTSSVFIIFMVSLLPKLHHFKEAKTTKNDKGERGE
ncbi:MAG: hypothetical protein GX817_04115 [Elusimicrobia bacterium]|nr:hypothetical protein [Elusimicrobiota bacterium]